MPDSSKPTLLLIDGHSLAYRAFFALPVENFTTKDNQHTNAIYGFLSMFVNLVKAEQPTHLAVSFDVSRASFRTTEYPDYKATRAATPSEFKGQIPLLQEALGALGVPVITKEGFEADDILATLSTQGSAAGFDVLVVSGDRDTIQLVNEEVTLLYPSVQGVSQLKRYDPAAVIEKYDVPPAQYPEIAALVGETSDNLPGVPKVGQKTAVKWIHQYGDLDNILAHAEDIGGVVGQNLRDHLDDVLRNRRLNALVRDVELELGPNDLARQPMDAQAVRDIFSRLEFRSLTPRVLDVFGSVDDVEELVETPVEVPDASVLDAQALGEWVTAHSAAPIAMTIATDGKLPTAIGLAAGGAVVEAAWNDEVLEALRGWLQSDAAKVLNDAKPQYKALRRAGVTLSGLSDDTLLGGYLLRPAFPDKTLAHLVDRFLGERLPEADPNQLVPESDGATVGQQSWFVERLAPAIRAELPDAVATVLDEIELPSITTLGDMELAGIVVSRTKLTEFSAELATRAEGIAQQAYAVLGREVNLGSPKQLQEVLFDELELPKTRKTKTGYTTDAAALTDLHEKTGHPFLTLLQQHREATKLRQIIESLLAAIGPDGRIHTTYLQTASQTGRLSSNDPNLQNIPVRTEESKRIRAAFEAGEGYEALMTADYSQIEMRIMAHLSEDPGLIDAFNSGEDLHRYVGSRVFGVPPEEVTSEMRTQVKAMSYGLVYGLSAFGLAKQLRIDQKAAKQLMLDYFSRFGGVRDYLRDSVLRAREDGYTETLFGRRRPFPDLNSPNRVLRENAERAALNAPIQGAAADIMKIGLNNIHRELLERGLGSRVLLQIHDELVLEITPGEWDEVERIVRDGMGSAAKLDVPLEVQLGRGQNWDEAAH